MASVARQDISLFNASKGKGVNGAYNSFERDIEDAIFEAVEIDGRETRMFQSLKEPKIVHISQIREQLISNQNDPSQRLSVFSKVNDARSRKTVLSQVFLTLAICAISVVLLLPIL